MRYFEKTEQKAASVKNQYLFTVAVAKRVRSLQEGAPALVEGVDNSVEQAAEAALREFAENRIDFDLEEKTK